MLRKIIHNISGWAEYRIRRLTGPLSPDKRVAVILTMLALFGGLSIYMTVSSIYNFGKDKGRRMEIRRIETLKTEHGQQEKDSINRLNILEYGRTTDE